MSILVMNYDSPIGPIEIHATDTAVSRVEFAGEQAGEGEGVSGVGGRSAALSSQEADAHPLLEEVRRQLERALFRRRLTLLRSAPGSGGTPFQRQVWQQLLGVGYGQTASYQDIAVAIDNPKAVRAVGAANGRNPVAIIVPCHRIIGSGGRAEVDWVWGWVVAEGVAAAA